MTFARVPESLQDIRQRLSAVAPDVGWGTTSDRYGVEGVLHLTPSRYLDGRLSLTIRVHLPRNTSPVGGAKGVGVSVRLSERLMDLDEAASLLKVAAPILQVLKGIEEDYKDRVILP